MVEDARVEKAMVEVGSVICKIADSGDKYPHRDELEDAVYELAHALRDGLTRAERISGPKKFRSSPKNDFSTLSAMNGHGRLFDHLVGAGEE
jgi:hypothetical protein